MAVFNKCITLTETQSSKLRKLAAERHTSEEALLSVALDHLAQDDDDGYRIRNEAWSREREFIEQRTKLGQVPGSRTWTREDLYDR